MHDREQSGDAPLSGLGEREIIRRLIAGHPSNAYIPPGDDCGAIAVDGRLLLLSTDTKTSATHFPEGFSPYDMGWSIVAANLSDIAAMGGDPIGFLVAYGLPRDTPFSVLSEMQSGLEACLSENSTPLVGADTKESADISLTGTAAGIVDKEEVMRRSGSHPGDVACVTGALGGAAQGLRSLRANLGMRAAEERFRRPTPRIGEGRLLARSGAVTSCIDVSDGLSSSLYELMRASSNGFAIDSSRVPIAESLSNAGQDREEVLQIALHSGDEYELLFTVAPSGLESLHHTYASALSVDFHEIGIVTDGGKVLLRRDGIDSPLPDRGFEHFR